MLIFEKYVIHMLNVFLWKRPNNLKHFYSTSISWWLLVEEPLLDPLVDLENEKECDDELWEPEAVDDVERDVVKTGEEEPEVDLENVQPDEVVEPPGDDVVPVDESEHMMLKCSKSLSICAGVLADWLMQILRRNPM